MIESVLLGLALMVGVDPRRLVVLGFALYLPLLAVGVMGFLFWRQRRRSESRSAVFCESVASDVRAGLPLRDALRSSAESLFGAELGLSSDASLTLLVDTISDELPDIGPELSLTVQNAHRTGAQIADLLDEIGALAIARSEVDREVRVASAPARATGLVFLVAPVLFLFYQIRNGSLGGLMAVPEQRLVVVIGLGLFVIGVSVAVLVWLRAS